MIRIGIVASDNSHAEAFSVLINRPDENGNMLYPDMKVTCIYGTDPARTQEVAQRGAIDSIVSTPQEMIGNVDAAMVVFRHGGLHAMHALPFIQAGIPTWVDKPFTVDPAEAEMLVAAAQKAGVLLSGGTTVRFGPQVQAFRDKLFAQKAIGNVHTGSVTYTASLESEYAGLFFYSPHAVETAMFLYGYEPLSVFTSAAGKAVTALVRYPEYLVSINLLEDYNQFNMAAWGSGGVLNENMSLASCYKHGLDAFVARLRAGDTSVHGQELIAPVRLTARILESLEKGVEVPF